MVYESSVGRVKKVDYGMWGSVVLKCVMIGGEEVVGIDGKVRKWGRLKSIVRDIGKKMKVNLDDKKIKECVGAYVEEKRYMRGDVCVVEDWVVV